VEINQQLFLQYHQPATATNAIAHHHSCKNSIFCPYELVKTKKGHLPLLHLNLIIFI
tara:strand:+ start:613 stop:783 length:171 start_codon:yes stop_codon:yes gene_type:complete